jgi:large subunit ribosomal protein L33
MVQKPHAIVVKLVSMAGTGYFYTTRKNAQLQKKLLLRKYDPIIRQHTLFREERISRRKK